MWKITSMLAVIMSKAATTTAAAGDEQHYDPHSTELAAQDFVLTFSLQNEQNESQYLQLDVQTRKDINMQGTEAEVHLPQQQWIVHPMAYYQAEGAYICKLQNFLKHREYLSEGATGDRPGHVCFSDSRPPRISSNGGTGSWTTLILEIADMDEQTGLINKVRIKSEKWGSKNYVGVNFLGQVVSISDGAAFTMRRVADGKPIHIEQWQRMFRLQGEEIRDVAATPPAQPIELETRVAVIDGQMAYVTACPFCGGQYGVAERDAHCKIFRHIVKRDGSIPDRSEMHASRYRINQWLHSGGIACGAPLRLVDINGTMTFTTGFYTD